MALTSRLLCVAVTSIEWLFVCNSVQKKKKKKKRERAGYLLIEITDNEKGELLLVYSTQQQY